MNLKFVVLLILSYLTAFVINFMPSLKHPDSEMNIINLFATIFFLLVIVIVAIKKTNPKKENKKLMVFLMSGAIAGVLVYFIKMYEDITFQYAVLDIIASIQYPIYLIFTTPLFGANILLDFSYATFALVTSFFYLLVFILSWRKSYEHKFNKGNF